MNYEDFPNNCAICATISVRKAIGSISQEIATWQDGHLYTTPLRVGANPKLMSTPSPIRLPSGFSHLGHLAIEFYFSFSGGLGAGGGIGTMRALVRKLSGKSFSLAIDPKPFRTIRSLRSVRGKLSPASCSSNSSSSSFIMSTFCPGEWEPAVLAHVERHGVRECAAGGAGVAVPGAVEVGEGTTAVVAVEVVGRDEDPGLAITIQKLL